MKFCTFVGIFSHVQTSIVKNRPIVFRTSKFVKCKNLEIQNFYENNAFFLFIQKKVKKAAASGKCPCKLYECYLSLQKHLVYKISRDCTQKKSRSIRTKNSRKSRTTEPPVCRFPPKTINLYQHKICVTHTEIFSENSSVHHRTCKSIKTQK